MRFAESEFELSVQQPDGATLRTHLTRAYEATGVLPDKLKDAPSLSLLLAHLWDWFLELNKERTGNGFGPNPLSSGQILNWQDLTGNKLEPWELRALRELDLIYLVSQLKKGGPQ